MHFEALLKIILIALSSISGISLIFNLADPPLFIFSLLSIIFYSTLYFFTYITNPKIKIIGLYFTLINILWIGLRILYISFRYDNFRINTQNILQLFIY